MEHKIINTGDYLLIVDDSEIKGGDWYIDLNLKQIFSKSNPQISKIDWQKKIISHLPLNNSTILEGVDLLPPIEDGVEELANTMFRNKIDSLEETHSDYILGVTEGYNKAKEKYKYTEENLKDIWEYVKNNRVTYKEYLQSLQQPKYPIGFESEMVCRNLGCMKMILNGENSVCCGDNMEPKTITNSQGLIQWIGEYIYD